MPPTERTFTVLFTDSYEEGETETEAIRSLRDGLEAACNEGGYFGGNFLIVQVDEGSKDFWAEWKARSKPSSEVEWCWTGWHDGAECSPAEPDKQWLAIEHWGEEFSTIVLRTDASIFQVAGGLDTLALARKEREDNAQRIVDALRAGS